LLLPIKLGRRTQGLARFDRKLDIAQGRKQAQVLASEGKYTERVNEAKVLFPLQ
jgi:hypothetical protein